MLKEELFESYSKETEPEKYEKSYAWHTAIGLQAVDGLKPSKYLLDTAIKNIEGEISIDEVQKLIHSYYKNNPELEANDRTKEADIVSSRITKILAENAFSFTPNEYISIHRKLFSDIYKHAGKIRDYNITKKEWILDDATVIYGSASELKTTLEYDFAEERSFNYDGLSMDEIINHLALFISRLWQIHIFGEGNTRTTAVFFIKYLRKLGFNVTNDIFAENAWYFRNALVRANYNNFEKGIYETTEYLKLFLRNLLLNENNNLSNRSMHISGKLNYIQKANIDDKKANIDDKKANIDDKKANIDGLSSKTKDQINKLYNEIGCDTIFGRSIVENIVGLKSTRSSELISIMLKHNIITPVKGYGKGKYIFSINL